MIKPGHNSKTLAATVAGQKIKSYVDRVEKLEEERKAIGGDIRDVYTEAKGNGYDVKTLRWLVQERKIQSVDRDERDALRDTYKHALDMAVHLVQVEGLSLREAAKRTGTNKSSVHRALAVPQVSQTPKQEDGDDGITESCGGVESGHAIPEGKGLVAKVIPLDRANDQTTAGVAPGPHDAERDEGADLLAVAAGQPSEPSVPAEQSINPVLPPCTTPGKERTPANTSPGGPEVARVAPPVSPITNEAPATPSVGAVAREPATERVATPFLGDDPGPPPSCLRRTPEQGRAV